MRELKFRAWHPEFEMNYLENLGWFDGLDSGEWDVMQFIGVHDKNGTEIYEGDILSFIDKTDYGLPYIGMVTFYNGSFVITTKCVYPSWSNYECVIIGNIHQNPELLNPC